MYFDTHAHYDDAAFDADRDAVLRALHGVGVGCVLNPGCDVPSSRRAADLAEQYPFVWAAAGLQPEECAGAGEAEFEAVEELCKQKKVVAVGEIGLDYHWPENPPRAFQQEVFRRQMAIARKFSLPVIVHDRDAHGDAMEMVRAFPDVRGVFHCYSGSPEMARELLERGWYLGFDGPVTYKNARRAPEVAAVTPPERILLETDSPYLPPVPCRGTRNDSRNLRYIAEKLAEWKGMTAAELESVTEQNAKRLFGLEQ